MPRFPHESQPFPLPISLRPDILVGGRLAHFEKQWGEFVQNKWVLLSYKKASGYHIFDSPTFYSSDKSESIFLPVITRRDNGTSPETGSGKGTRSWNSQFLFPAISCPEKERKCMSCNRSFSIESIHKERTIQNGKSQVSKTIDTSQRLGCLHGSDRCLSTRSDSSSIQEGPSFHVRKSGLPIHGPTFRNVPKSVDFHQTDGRNRSSFASTCHLTVSVPRRLAYTIYCLQTVQNLGFIPNLKTSDLKPAQQFTFVGIEFLIQQNIVRVPEDRIKQFLTQTQVSARTFLSLLGKFSAAADLVVLDRLDLRPLQMSYWLETSYSVSRSSSSDQQYNLWFIRWI